MVLFFILKFIAKTVNEPKRMPPNAIKHDTDKYYTYDNPYMGEDLNLVQKTRSHFRLGLVPVDFNQSKKEVFYFAAVDTNKYYLDDSHFDIQINKGYSKKRTDDDMRQSHLGRNKWSEEDLENEKHKVGHYMDKIYGPEEANKQILKPVPPSMKNSFAIKIGGKYVCADHNQLKFCSEKGGTSEGLFIWEMKQRTNKKDEIQIRMKGKCMKLRNPVFYKKVPFFIVEMGNCKSKNSWWTINLAPLIDNRGKSRYSQAIINAYKKQSQKYNHLPISEIKKEYEN